MADLAKSDKPAHGFNDVVRSFSARLINDKDTVDGEEAVASGAYASIIFPDFSRFAAVDRCDRRFLQTDRG